MARPRRRRISVLMALLAPAFLSAGLLVGSAVPAQAIGVVPNSESPVVGEENVPTNTNVRVTFDVPARGVDDTTFTLAPQGGAPVAAVLTADATNTTFTLNPNANLQPSTTYTVSLSSGITDRTVTPAALAPTSWTFFTGAGSTDTTAPTVTDRVPGSGATGVSTQVTVSVTFSEAVQGVDGSSFTLERTSTGVRVPAIVFQRGVSNTWSLNPDTPLVDGASYTASLTGGPAGISDLAGNALADTSWSFRTGGGVDTVGPQVLSRFPRPGSRGVNRLTDVRVRFSEPVRRVNDATFTLTNTRNGDEVLATVTRLGGSRQWVLEPDRALRRGTRYVARLFGGGIQDLSGNALRSTAWSFRTRF